MPVTHNHEEAKVMKRHTITAALVTVTSALTASTAVCAAEGGYPSRPVRLVLGFAAGGTPDSLARTVAAQVESQWGRNIIVDNRVGANGLIAAEIVASANPDGYTILFSPPALIINQIIYRKVPYDVLRDFVPAANVCIGEGSLLVVNPAVPAKSVRELVALAKNPDKPITYGTPGVGNTQHLVTELFNMHAGTKLMHVPYKSLVPALSAVLSGEVNVLFAPPAILVQHIKSGRLRVLGFTGASRWKLMPEVPTIAEAGVPGFEVSGSWQGWFVPVRTQAAAVARINAEVAKAIQVPHVRDFILRAGYEPDTRSVDEFHKLILADLKRYRDIVRRAGIKAD
jgi:tripartite-type tricarboxylate transporter receptor subunit TctC